MPDAFEVVALTCHSNIEQLMQLAEKYRPRMVALTCVAAHDEARAFFKSRGISFYSGPDALVQLCQNAVYDLFINAVVGAAGFLPTLQAIETGAVIALANKETLVMGGEIVMDAAKRKNVPILPIDSEHSAIFQCLFGENPHDIETIFLTASGGPFRDWPLERLAAATAGEALKHPNWNMGKKITIDSATMMNKGLEVIEAHWLFNVSLEQVRVVIHPESIIHSMVAFHDGSVKAQLGVPDMRVPIQLAMTYPERRPSRFPRLDFTTLRELHFDSPDLTKFKALSLAYQAARSGGTAPAVMNAANEEAVKLFLDGRLGFLEIAENIEETLMTHQVVEHPGVEELLDADRWARWFVLNKNM
jgi:1-deoxy-D-xylulose-5-phosphate reductoisomerase